MDIETISRQVLGSKSIKWSGTLTRIGFSGAQAEGLLSGVMERIVGLISTGQLDLCADLDTQRLLERLGVGVLASRIGVDADKALEGLQAVVPDFVRTLQEYVGLGGTQPGAGGTGDGFGELFGR